jgi:hypothetical protein
LDENLGNSAARLASFGVETLSSPPFNINGFHFRTVVLQIQSHAHCFEIFEAAIYENLHHNTLTSLYFASMFLMILRQSLGLLVI